MNRPTSSELLLPVELPREEPEQGIMSDLLVLTKARLSFLVVITTLVGFCMAAGAVLDWVKLLNTVFGTALSAAGAAVLNQWVESNVDRLMERTRYRPLPSGRMKPSTALAIGVALAASGVGFLALTTNALSAALAAATVGIYLFVYTPLKRKTSLCTIAGAVAGAIPPVIGWTAVRPELGVGAWVLFGVLFTWQMPHFLAIAWMYRDEYAQAGFVMLKRDDRSGEATAIESMLFTLGLGATTLVPFTAGLNSGIYLAGALVLDVALLGCAGAFLLQRDRPTARRLFFASILYLPLLLGLMVFTRA